MYENDAGASTIGLMEIRVLKYNVHHSPRGRGRRGGGGGEGKGREGRDFLTFG